MPEALALLARARTRRPRAPAGIAFGRVRTRMRWLRREPSIMLTVALAAPAMLAAVSVGRPDAAARALLAAMAAAFVQFVLVAVQRRWHPLRRRDLQLVQLFVALVLTAVLIEFVVPATYASYVPVVALAAAVGSLEGAVILLGAVILYLLPVLIAPGTVDHDAVARGIAGGGISALVAVGTRYFVAGREAIARELRTTARRERRRARQLSGIEEVGRLLAVSGLTKEALARVVDVLVSQFGYRYVSLYLARPDGSLELGAQRGYAAAIETFDGRSGVVGRIMRERRAELVADVSVDRDYVAVNPDVVSEVCAPLLDGDSLLGIVNVESAGTALDEADRRAVVAVADRLAAYVALWRERQRLAELSVRDPLTGLANRRVLEERIEGLFAARARREPAERPSLALLLFDLDHFGRLNNAHGHAAGDEVLRVVGRLFASRFRVSDLVARYGGEEFVVVLDGATLEQAAERAEEVRVGLAATVIDGADGRIRVTVSAGCTALGEGQEATWADLLAAADVALGMAKRAGRNQVVCASV